LREPSQLLIDITTPDGQQSGLKVTSAVACSNLDTVHERHLIKTLGHLPTALMQRVDLCLKAALGLP
jgi:mRNA interferase MazF